MHLRSAAAIALLTAIAPAVSADPAQPVAATASHGLARVEARSRTLLAVAMVRDDRMSIHVSRIADNAPVRDAVLSVALRGVVHSTVAEADGSYTLRSKDLELPGTAVVQFEVTEDGAHQSLTSTLLKPADSATQPSAKNSARQLWWWVLNFGVCIGFLWLFSRRRKAAKD